MTKGTGVFIPTYCRKPDGRPNAEPVNHTSDFLAASAPSSVQMLLYPHCSSMGHTTRTPSSSCSGLLPSFDSSPRMSFAGSDEGYPMSCNSAISCSTIFDAGAAQAAAVMGYSNNMMLQPQPRLLPQAYVPVDAPCATSLIGQELYDIMLLEAQEAEVDAAITRLLNIRRRLVSLRRPALPLLTPTPPLNAMQQQLLQLMQQQQLMGRSTMVLQGNAEAAAIAVQGNMYQASLVEAPYLQMQQQLQAQQPLGRPDEAEVVQLLLSL